MTTSSPALVSARSALHDPGAIATRNARRFPNRTAYIHGERSLTWAQVQDRSCALAAGLARAGVGPRDHVALLAGNDLEWMVAQFAVWKLAAVPVFLHCMLPDAPLAGQLAQSRCTALLVGPTFADRVPALRELTPIPLAVGWGGAGGGSENAGQAGGAELVGMEDLVERHLGAGDPDVAPGPDDVAMLAYSSGTTGVPKGAVNTCHNLLAKTMSMIAAEELKEREVGLVAGPMYMGGTQIMSLVPYAMLGMPCVLLPAFDPEQLLAAVARHRVSTFFAVPTMIRALANVPAGAHDTSSLDRVVSAGAPLTSELYQAWRARFGAGVYELCGTSETGGGLAITEADRGRGKAGSVGRPMLGFSVAIVDEDDREVGVGVRGEMVVAGDPVASGYFEQPELQAQTYRNGWFHTGDIASVDDEGYYYIVDRSKDMIISGGQNVYPREVEEVLAGIEGVRECAVIGIPHEHWGEVVHAVVVPQPQGSPDEQEIIAGARIRLAGFQAPKSVSFVDALPLTPLGKVSKKALRDPYWAGRERGI